MKRLIIKIVLFCGIFCCVFPSLVYADVATPGIFRLISTIENRCNPRDILFSGICLFIILGLTKLGKLHKKNLSLTTNEVSFKIFPVTEKNFALGLNLIVNSSGYYSYSICKESSNNVIELSKGHHNKEDGADIKDLFFFERPEKGKVLKYIVKASFKTFPPNIEFFEFEKKVTIYNVDGVFNIFVNQ